MYQTNAVKMNDHCGRRSLHYHRSLFFLLMTFILAKGLEAQQLLAPYQPTKAEILERYRKARTLDSLAPRSIYKAAVQAHWRQDGSAFWYRNFLKDSVKEYVYVDVANGIRRKMMLDSLPKDTVRSQGFGHSWSRWASFSTDSLSPDRQFVAYIKDGNVFIRTANWGSAGSAASGGGEPIQFTRDGDTARPYGNLAWSPDSKYVVGYHINPVKDSAVYYVLSSVAGTTRGQSRLTPSFMNPGSLPTTCQVPMRYSSLLKKTVGIISTG